MSYAKRFAGVDETYAAFNLGAEADAEIAALRERCEALEAALETCADISSQPGVVAIARALLEKKP